MKLLALAAAVIVAVVAVGASMYRDRATETSIDIPASSAQVWRVLMDFPAYPQWNPMVRHISGEPAVGKKLTVRVSNQGSEMSFSPKVLARHDERELRWMGRVLLPRLLDGEHFFRLEGSGSGTRFTQGERFRGVLVPFAGSAIDVRDSFDAANAALRDRVLATISR